jgi:GABA(A) receptor-associated protein
MNYLNWKTWLRKEPTEPTNSFNFRAKYGFVERLNESQRILEKEPSRKPVIIEKANTCPRKISELKKHKFLFDKDLKISQMMILVRELIKLDVREPIILMTDDNYLPSISSTVEKLYDEHKNDDGFLYVTYSTQEMYGEGIMKGFKKNFNKYVFSYNTT